MAPPINRVTVRATLTKQHGRYCLQFYEKHRTPNRKRVAVKTTRKREAKTHKRRLEEAYRDREFDPWRDDPFTLQKKDREPKTVREALDAFLTAKEEAGRSENTLDCYEGIVRRFIDRIAEETLLQNVAHQSLAAYIRDPEVAETTQHKRYRHIKAFLRWCIDEGIIVHNRLDRIDPPDKPKKLPKVMTEEEMRDICSALRSDYEES